MLSSRCSLPAPPVAVRTRQHRSVLPAPPTVSTRLSPMSHSRLPQPSLMSVQAQTQGEEKRV